MMNLNEVVRYLEENYSELKPEIVTSAKNGGEKTGISVSVREGFSMIYYPSEEDTDLRGVAEKILDQLEAAKEEVPLENFKMPKTLSEVEDILSIGVMNEKHEDMVKSHQVVTKRMEDVILYPVVVLNQNMSFKVTENFLTLWDVTVDQVFDAAFASKELNNVSLLTFDAIFESKPVNYLDGTKTIPENTPFLCLRSQGSYLTAGAIFSREIQEKLISMFPDGFYILPSSIYEVLIISFKMAGAADAEDFKSIVKEINGTDAVTSEDYLSDSVYTIVDHKFKKIA